MNFKTSPFQNCLFQFRSFNLFSRYIQLYSLKQRSISQCFYVKYFLENEYITINTNKSLRSFRNGDRKNNIRQIESRDSMKDRERRVDKRVVMKINADNIWSEKRGRGGFSCDIETGTGERVEKKRGDGLVPSGEERRIGSLRRRLQKDSRERGSGIFIIGIPVTVSKPFTALISVATVKEDTECKKRRGRE